MILPETIPDYGDQVAVLQGQTNWLIAGKNGGLVDTMIFANINPETRKITLISLPRDLYYNNRKINSYYTLFGMEEMKRVLSQITGFQIDHYILIDMYAFVEVIDLIGGIDVHLDEAVIDPTYRVKEGDTWSTLYYRPGDYHLSGTQALRLARTRHTSSDFARAERQQMLLKAVQQKARNFGFGDAAKVTSLAEAILSRTETDISLPEAIADYFRFQGLEISGGNVLSSGNVLESKDTGANKKDVCLSDLARKHKMAPMEAEVYEKAKQICEGIKGEYILVPQNNNWNVIRWYFHQILEKA